MIRRFAIIISDKGKALCRAALIVLCLLGLQGISMPTAMAAQKTVDAPAAVILHFHAVLLSVMQRANKLGYKGRYAKLEPEIRKAYDLPMVARLTLGKAWSKLNSKQRAQFVGIFSRLVIATYAHNFDGYSGEKFNNVSQQRLDPDQVVINTLLSRRNGDNVQLDYVLRQSHGKWKIINVVADGASDLALKRADFTAVLRHLGFPVLLKKLEGKIAQYQ